MRHTEIGPARYGAKSRQDPRALGVCCVVPLRQERHALAASRAACDPEAGVAAGGQADDAAPGRLAGDVAAGELADHQGRGHRVDGKPPGPGLGGDRLEGSAQPVGPGRCEGVGQPSGCVVDQDVDCPELLLCGSSSKTGMARSDRSAATAAAVPPPSRMR
jgi:hypothetical protein